MNKLKYILLGANRDKDPEGFENARFHTINYILRQGEVPIKKPDAQERLRPEYNKEEFGVVTSDNFFYSYSIEPSVRGKDRNLTIMVGSADNDLLKEEVAKLMRGSSLDKISL